jgi:hypothetical protein
MVWVKWVFEAITARATSFASIVPFERGLRRCLGHHLFGAARDKAGVDHPWGHDNNADLVAQHASQRHAHRVERSLRR